MLRTRGITIAVTAAMLALSACSSSSGSDSTPAPVATEASVPAMSDPAPQPTAEETTGVTATERPYKPEETTPAQPELQGADAAPNAVAAYDTSQLAYEKFAAWWSYEVLTQQDANISDQNVYSAGAGACVSYSRGVGTDIILAGIERDLGFTKSGAAGIYKAALEALCTQYNRGYRTFFDRNVDNMMAQVTPKINFNPAIPPYYQFGYFLKEVCAALSLSQIGGSGIVNHMRTVMPQPNLIQGATPDSVLYIYIKSAVFNGCQSYITQLPPVVQNSF